MDITLREHIGKMGSFFLYNGKTNMFSSGIITDVFVTDTSILVSFGKSDTVNIENWKSAVLDIVSESELHYYVGDIMEVILED